MACLAEQRLVSEKPFLVGESKAYDESKPMPRPPKHEKEEEEECADKESDTPKEAKREQDDDDVDSLDIEKLRPAKHLDLLAHQSTTPSRYMMPASQVSGIKMVPSAFFKRRSALPR